MQLYQIMMFDNKTTSTIIVPDDTDLSCTEVAEYESTGAIAVLIPSDGHIWVAERNGMMCNQI